MAQCVVPRAMIETNKKRACCVVARPPSLNDSGGGRPPRTRPLNTLRSCRSTLATSPGGCGGARTGVALCAWAGLARSTLTGAASRILKLLALSSRGSSQPPLPLLDASFYSPATPKAYIIKQSHCVSHCCRASPRTASLRSTHCIPNTQTPTRRTADALGRQKSGELRANQEAGMDAAHGDKKKAEGIGSAFRTV